MISTLRSAIRRIVVEDDGQDLVEYALLTGIVAITGVAVYGILRTNMAQAYDSWINPDTPGSIQDNWVPPPPGQ